MELQSDQSSVLFTNTEINWEVVFCLSNTNFPNWMELLGIKGEYKKLGQRINIFLLNINLKMYYI